jgi:hypothetical protein
MGEEDSSLAIEIPNGASRNEESPLKLIRFLKIPSLYLYNNCSENR